MSSRIPTGLEVSPLKASSASCSLHTEKSGSTFVGGAAKEPVPQNEMVLRRSTGKWGGMNQSF